VGREYNRRLKKAFDAAGIEIPYPHRTLYWGEASQPFQLRPLAEDNSHSGDGSGGQREPHSQGAQGAR
jgi:small conductance mechanosensitive channel